MTSLLLPAIPLPLLAAVAAEDDTAASILALKRAAPLARPIRGLDPFGMIHARSSYLNPELR